MNHRLTAIIHAEGDGYVAVCPELDVVSQGDGIVEARTNLSEAVALFLECANEEERAQRLRGDVFVTSLEVSVA